MLFLHAMSKLKIPRYIQWLFLTGIIFIVLMSLLRLSFVLAFRSPSTASVDLTGAYFLGLRFDLRMVCIVSLVFFILGNIPGLHPLDKKWGKRISFWIWVLVIIVFALFYVIDFANYAYLSQRVTVNILAFLQDAKISAGVVWQTYPVIWIIIALVLLCSILLAIITFTYNIILSRPKSATTKSRIFWGILFFLLMGLGVFGRWGQYPLRWSDAFVFGNDFAANVSLNPFESFFSSLQFKSSTYDLEKTKAAYPFMANYLNVDHPDIETLNYDRTFVSSDSVTNQPNVVLVICESFSAYKSSMYGNPLNTTPFFAELSEKGIFFDRFFTNSYGTARGVWATLTGVPDVQLINTSTRNPASVNQHILINDFNGYEKLYFIGGSTSWANLRGLLSDNIRGLRRYEQDDYDAPKLDVWGVSDKNLFLGANKILAKETKPFFAVIQTADNHRPYSIPKEDLKEFKLQKVPKDSLKKYGFESEEEYNAFRYTDYCFKVFMNAAGKEAYFDNTIFVFAGDHGIRGDAVNLFPKVWTEQGLTSEHVPFLIYAPSLVKPARHSYLSSQIDILPTIASLCNISYTNTALGRNLLDKRILGGDSLHNAIFIFDPDVKRIGIIYDGLYYSYGLNNSSPEQIGSLENNEPVHITDSMRILYKSITNDFYETSRYLLFNNRKK